MTHEEQWDVLRAGKILRESFGERQLRWHAEELELQHRYRGAWHITATMFFPCEAVDVLDPEPEPERRTGLTLAECVQLGEGWVFRRKCWKITREGLCVREGMLTFEFGGTPQLPVASFLSSDWEAAKDE